MRARCTMSSGQGTSDGLTGALAPDRWRAVIPATPRALSWRPAGCGSRNASPPINPQIPPKSLFLLFQATCAPVRQFRVARSSSMGLPRPYRGKYTGEPAPLPRENRLPAHHPWGSPGNAPIPSQPGPLRRRRSSAISPRPTRAIVPGSGTSVVPAPPDAPSGS